MPASTEEQGALFQALIHKISQTGDPARLRDASLAALGLMLRRPSDQTLRVNLTSQIDSILAGIEPDRPETVHLAARQCLVVLRRARDARLPQVDSARGLRSPPKRHRSPSSSHHHAAARALTIAGGGTVLVGCLLWAWGLTVHPAPAPEMADGQRLAEQIAAAAEAAPMPTHLLGGPLRRTVQEGQPTVVVAEKVPPQACTAAGWTLVRKGTLSINGITPSRLSAARITELCNQSSVASLRWVPKTAP